MGRVNKEDLTPVQLEALEAQKTKYESQTQGEGTVISDASGEPKSDAASAEQPAREAKSKSGGRKGKAEQPAREAKSKSGGRKGKAEQPAGEAKSKSGGRKGKADQTDTEETEGKDTQSKTKRAACAHEYVFHSSQTHRDHPGKNFVYCRCIQCNDLKMTVENVKGK